MRRIYIGGAFVSIPVIVLAWIAFFSGGGGGAWTCDRSAADTAALATETTAATAGQSICLTANTVYDPWVAPNKAVTVEPAPGVTGATLRMLALGPTIGGQPTCCFTVNGRGTLKLRGVGSGPSASDYVRVEAGAHDVTIENSVFRYDGLRVDNDNGASSLNIRVEGNDFSFNDYCNNTDCSDACPQCTGVQVSGCPAADANITVKGNVFRDGSLTGVKLGCGTLVEDNLFTNLCTVATENPEIHQDNIQFIGGGYNVIRGNLITRQPGGRDCYASDVSTPGGIAAYDQLNHDLIEDNVVYGIDRPAGIEIESDDTSTVRYNTLEATRATCSISQHCGQISIDSRNPYDDGFGTKVYDNIAYAIGVGSRATVARNDHNLLATGASGSNIAGTPTFAGTITSTSPIASYHLATGSAGKGAADDGGDVGANGKGVVICDLTAADAAELSTDTSLATAGQKICLTNQVDYGVWDGTDKAVTLRAQTAAGVPVDATIRLLLSTGDKDFTIDGARQRWDSSHGLTIGSSTFTGFTPPDPQHITIKNAAVNCTGFGSGGCIEIEDDADPTHSSVFDHDVFHDIPGDVNQWEAAIRFSYSVDTDTGWTVKDSLFRDNSADSLKIGADVTILNNKILRALEVNGSHTDAIQLLAGRNSTIRGNWIDDCSQAIGGFDGMGPTLIEHNLITRCFTHHIAALGDNPASTIRFNTIADGTAMRIECGAKIGDPTAISSIYDNVARALDLNSGGGAACVPTRNDHNLCDLACGSGSSQALGVPVWVNGSTPGSYDGYCLTGSSPGHAAADDSGQVGICGGDYNSATDGPPKNEGY